MALFTDGKISTIEDLTEYESGILDVAVTEQIDLTIKLGLAEEELGIDLEAFLARRENPPGLGNLVVTEPLKKCHLFRALALAFRDAYHRQLNDRYLAKWKEYIRLSGWAWDALMQTGLGVLDDPVPRAAKPQLSVTAGAGGAATYFVRVAWRSSAGEEGIASEQATLAVSSGYLLTVTAVKPPAAASGWNVYAGLSADSLTLQNAAPLAVGSVWTLPETGLVDGAAPGEGQAVEYFLKPGPQVLWR